MGIFRSVLDKILESFCCALLVFMTCTATWQVVSRYVLNNPSTVTEELTLMSFVWTGVLAAAYVFGQQKHMQMTFLLDKFSESGQIKIKLLIEVIIFIFAALILVFGGMKISHLAMGQTSSSLKIPMGYIYFALPLSGILTCIYSILNFVDMAKILLISKDKDMSKSI